MKPKIEKYKKKLKAIKHILKYDSFDLATELSPQDEFKVILSTELNTILNPKNIQEKQYLQNAIDRVNAKVFGEKSKEQSLLEVVESLFGDRMWFYTVISGYASLWEMKVKLLASRYGVDVKKPYEVRSKKQKKFKMTIYKDLSEIINEFQAKTNKCFNLDLKTIADIRSALVHGNFDQLRILFNNCSKKIKETHKGNVVVFNPVSPGDRIQNMSDDLDKDVKESQDIFGWFIEGTNSRLLEEVWEFLNDSVSKVDQLVEFKAISFDERKDMFNKIVSGELKVNKEVIDVYQKYFDFMPSQKGRKADEYFKMLNKLFNQNIIEGSR